MRVPQDRTEIETSSGRNIIHRCEQCIVLSCALLHRLLSKVVWPPWLPRSFVPFILFPLIVALQTRCVVD